jgi:hypothetical protein
MHEFSMHHNGTKIRQICKVEQKVVVKNRVLNVGISCLVH